MPGFGVVFLPTFACLKSAYISSLAMLSLSGGSVLPSASFLLNSSTSDDDDDMARIVASADSGAWRRR